MTDEVSPLVEHLFRRESSRLIGWLVRVLGPSQLHLAEDAVQFAMVQALRTWPFHGVPPKPAAWLAQVARNRARDLGRSARIAEANLLRLALDDEQVAPIEPAFAGEIADEALSLVFGCCHPMVPDGARGALTLNIVCGFGVREIARALLAEETTIAQRLVRAKRLIAERGVTFEVPVGAALCERRAGVLDVVYLLFNEGYEATDGDHRMRLELCAEARRLVLLLCEHEATAAPVVHALAALLHLLSARLPARIDAHGAVLLLEEQDRTRWDGEQLAAGMHHLALAADGEELTTFHLQAGIAAAHAVARSFEETDWDEIVGLYEALLRLAPSPVVALNRAVAVAMRDGPLAGLAAIDALPPSKELDRYAPRYAVHGELLRRAGRHAEAATWFARAAELPCSAPQRAFLRARMG